MPEFAQMLSGIVGRNVIDKTGLKAKCDIALSWAPQPGQNSPAPDHVMPARTEREGAGADSGLLSIFTAIQE